MKPVKVTFYVYAEDEREAESLQAALHDFVDVNYRQGILVRAGSLDRLLRLYGSNPLINKFIK